ncbi:MAG: hypothetical protein A2X52_09780 [Candidatus Rokubacteria bacterium GWC2_70_16]|nr:MAG: hypothetical protein A2X52_09780 [Candidatus Rokubacteria bacterium GWC2_70_16]
MPMLRCASVALLVMWMLWPVSSHAQAVKAGVVSTVSGKVTAIRAGVPQPLPLKFKDDVFLQDKIATGEQSLARVLLGGRALVTVRELSVLTITEIPGQATINLESGKVSLAVARDRMRPGESIEVRTPNAVAAVRGTVLITETDRIAGQVPRTAMYLTSDPTARGVPVTHLNPATGLAVGPAATLNLNMAFFATGIDPLSTRQMTEADHARARAGLQDYVPPHLQAANQQQVTQAQLREATQLANTLNEQPPPTATVAGAQSAQQAVVEAQEEQNSTSDISVATTTTTTTVTTLPAPPPPASATFTAGPPAAPTTPELLTNGGFDSGLTGWTSTGAASALASLGPFGPNGSSMAIIHTGTGAVGGTTSTLSQVFPIASPTLTKVKFWYTFLTNEYPTFSVNDFFNAKLISPAGAPTVLATASRLGSPLTANPSAFSGGGFTLGTGNGILTSAFTFSSTSMLLTPGSWTLFFEVVDVSDTIVDSAALIDVAQVVTDPPLYIVWDGSTLDRADRDPLLRLTSTSRTFDSLLAVCCGSTVRLAGPLLHAADTDLEVPFSLVTLTSGGTLATSTTEPLVLLEGGRQSLGAADGVFEIWGVNTALDPETGLVLGTDRPLQHAGVLLETSGATVTTERIVRLDSALLEASQPILNLTNRSHLTTAGSAVDLSYRARVTSLGTLMRLDGSALTVAQGALVSLAGGSVLSVGGDLITLVNGSTLSLLNGPLLSLSGGSLASIAGGLVAFGGSGGNALKVANSLCSPCSLIGGIPVALTNGAVASNVNIAGSPIKNQGLGSVTLSNPTLGNGGTALAVVSGATSKLTVAGK